MQLCPSGAKFDDRNNPRDKTLHVKGCYILPLIKGDPPKGVTLSSCKRALTTKPIP